MSSGFTSGSDGVFNFGYKDSAFISFLQIFLRKICIFDAKTKGKTPCRTNSMNNEYFACGV